MLLKFKNMKFSHFVAASLIANCIALNSYSYYYSHWCGSGLQYLDDSKCAKKFPSAQADREWACPINVKDEVPSGYFEDSPLSEVKIDTSTLSSIVTTGADICVILTRRVLVSSGEVKLFNKYGNVHNYCY